MNIVSNTFGVKNFANMTFGEANVVVITNARYRDIAVLEVTDGEDKDAAVRRYLAELTLGCNYRYEIVKKIGNTYFCN